MRQYSLPMVQCVLRFLGPAAGIYFLFLSELAQYGCWKVFMIVWVFFFLTHTWSRRWCCCWMCIHVGSVSTCLVYTSEMKQCLQSYFVKLLFPDHFAWHRSLISMTKMRLSPEETWRYESVCQPVLLGHKGWVCLTRCMSAEYQEFPHVCG